MTRTPWSERLAERAELERAFWLAIYIAEGLPPADAAEKADRRALQFVAILLDGARREGVFVPGAPLDDAWRDLPGEDTP